MSKALQRDLQLLLGGDPFGGVLRQAPSLRGSAPKVVSAAAPIETSGAPSGGGGGSLAGPFTEVSRTFHAERTVMSTDGFFGLRVTPCASISFTDANSETVLFNLADPA